MPIGSISACLPKGSKVCGLVGRVFAHAQSLGFDPSTAWWDMPVLPALEGRGRRTRSSESSSANDELKPAH